MITSPLITSDVRWPTMILTRQDQRARWRILCALLALLLGSISPSVASFSSTWDVCSMTCCVERGHCCCNPHHTYVEGQTPGGGPGFTTAKIFAPCPEGCATTSISSSLLFGDLARASAHYLHLAVAAIIYSQPGLGSLKPIEPGHSSPRAPPHSLISQNT
jgi:hypothetical protein